jgi:hypothetical protein
MRHLEAVTKSSFTQPHPVCPLHMNNYVQNFLGIIKEEREKLHGKTIRSSFPKLISVKLNKPIFVKRCPSYS